MARPGRPAIKPYSTRCQPAWQAELKPSKLYQFILSVGGAASLFAIFLTDIHTFWQCLLMLAVFIAAATQIIRYRRRILVVRHHAAQARWDITQNLRPPHLSVGDSVSGNLVRLGYRSAHLVILVLQSDDKVLHREPVWRDQLKAQEFSYLHHQLAFASIHPERRPLRAKLGLGYRDRCQ